MRNLTLASTLAILACHHDDTGSAPALRLGTTTTVQQSGLLAIAESSWSATPLSVVVGPSGQILRAAAQGDLDVVLTHAPALEAKLLAGRPGVERCPFVISRFAIVGPAADPARVATARTAAEAMQRIARQGAGFVSRGDSSGTHERESALWHAAGLAPSGHSWYVESGTDQTTTLRIADERGTYALADLPTFGRVGGLELRALFDADSSLINPYTLYLVPARPPHPGAHRFIAWALDRWRSRGLALHLPDGSPAFEPARGACTTS